MITNQQIFDTVVANLRKQGAPSVNGSWCRYRDSKGRKCAAGWLIPDTHYQECFEKNSINTIVENYGEKNIFGDEVESLRLIERLQEIHDDYEPEEWENEWEEIADYYELQMPK